MTVAGFSEGVPLWRVNFELILWIPAFDRMLCGTREHPNFRDLEADLPLAGLELLKSRSQPETIANRALAADRGSCAAWNPRRRFCG
jgi:hypothetical protein